MPCTADSVSSSILAAKSLKRNPLILATNEEVRQALQGDIMTVGELADFLQMHPSMQFHTSTISREAIDLLVQLETRQ
jgi:hypothetical protein